MKRICKRIIAIPVPETLLTCDFERKEQIVYLYCILKDISLKNGRKEFTIRYMNLSDITGMAYRTIKRALTYLEESGYIVVNNGINRTLIVGVLK